jgi:hypothetical protein
LVGFGCGDVDIEMRGVDQLGVLLTAYLVAMSALTRQGRWIRL